MVVNSYSHNENNMNDNLINSKSHSINSEIGNNILSNTVSPNNNKIDMIKSNLHNVFYDPRPNNNEDKIFTKN